MLLDYPGSFWLETIAVDLVAAFEVYMESSSEPSLIARHVVADAGLVLLLAAIYKLTVRRKHDAYC